MVREFSLQNSALHNLVIITFSRIPLYLLLNPYNADIMCLVERHCIEQLIGGVPVKEPVTIDNTYIMFIF